MSPPSVCVPPDADSSPMFCVTIGMNSFKSPPAQKALSPAPVMIATHRSGSSRKSSQALASKPERFEVERVAALRAG